MKALADALGVPGILGIGALIFCLAFYGSGLVPLREELAAAQLAASPRAHKPAALPVGHHGAMHALHERFPALETLPAEVERLYHLGGRAGLRLAKGEYRLETRAGALSSYRVSLPVRGPYPALRRFVGEVLTAMPLASIDGLRFERRKPNEGEVDTRIQLTLFFRPATREDPR